MSGFAPIARPRLHNPDYTLPARWYLDTGKHVDLLNKLRRRYSVLAVEVNEYLQADSYLRTNESQIVEGRRDRN